MNPEPPPAVGHDLTLHALLPEGWRVYLDRTRVPWPRDVVTVVVPAVPPGEHDLFVLDANDALQLAWSFTMGPGPLRLELHHAILRRDSLARGKHGIVTFDPVAHARWGYVADLTLRAMPWIDAVRRVREFEPIGRDAAGRMLVPVVVRDHGMVVVPVTAAELRALLAQLLPMRGALRGNGTYPYELTLPTPPDPFLGERPPPSAISPSGGA